MPRLRLRVVFDTNIFIQAFLNPRGPSGQCFQLARERKIRLFVSKRTLTEIEEVIDRSAIHSVVHLNYEEQKDRFLMEIKSSAYRSTDLSCEFELLRDPKDEMIIDLAVGCEADFIVSWDKDLLDLMTGHDSVSKQFRQRFRHLKIVKPDEFLRTMLSRELPIDP